MSNVCLIIMGGDPDPAHQLSDAVMATVATHGGNVLARCNLCVNTSRAIFVETSLGSGVFVSQLLNAAELKPAETHLLSFPSEGNAKAWLDAQATQLKAKTVFHVLVT